VQIVKELEEDGRRDREKVGSERRFDGDGGKQSHSMLTYKYCECQAKPEAHYMIDGEEDRGRTAEF
jgi:hypothetical protein